MTTKQLRSFSSSRFLFEMYNVSTSIDFEYQKIQVLTAIATPEAERKIEILKTTINRLTKWQRKQIYLWLRRTQGASSSIN